MRLHRAAPLAAVVLTLSVLAGPGSAAPYDGGLSTPQEDSYYPEHGDPGIDVLHYGLDLEWNKRTLKGVASIALRATADADSFQLDLGQAMEVRSVTVDGESASTTHRHHVLQVAAPVVADTRYDVRVTYRGRPAPVAAPTTRSDERVIGMKVVDGRLRTMQEPFGAFTWYPSNDQPSDKALYDITIAVPGRWVGVSNGKLVSQRRVGNRTITRFHLADPVATYLTTLAVGPYVHRTAKGPHGLPLNYWLPRGEASRYMKALVHVPADLRWLEERLGRYPFESAGVVVVPGQSAMETQTLVTFGKQTWGTPEQARETMVHELAHQWYGDTQTPSDWSDLWLNEGMAMYLQARWSADHTSLTWRDWIAYFRYYNVEMREEQGGPGAYDPGMFATGCVYYCSATMYDTLRHKVGDRKFWAIVERWPHREPGGNVDRAGFERYIEHATGKNLTRFFDDWLSSPTWPPR